ncbi:MAG: DivIVA domain-containing protein [Clostridia bacterium]|nr:DivIVA domain-containing protein [Clostridia bacterium]
MSVQNVLKKPTFGKNVMGYSISEVDKYIAYVTERYNSVCAESSELKRRVLRLQLMLDEASARLAEKEEEERVEKPLDRSALSAVFDVLDAEKKRTAEFYEELKATLNKISEVKNEFDDDREWEEVLNSFIESVSDVSAESCEDEPSVPEAAVEDVEATDVSPVGDASVVEDFENFVMLTDATEEADEADESEESDEAEEAEGDSVPAIPEDEGYEEEPAPDEVAAEYETSASESEVSEEPTRDDAESDSSYEEETEMLLRLLHGTFGVEADRKPFDPDLGSEYEGEVGEGGEFDDGFDTEFRDDELFDDASDEAFDEAPEGEEPKKREKTPAEIAAELDFYTDSVYRDGESFDPMTLAHNSTSRVKPKYEDFFTSDFNKTKKK